MAKNYFSNCIVTLGVYQFIEQRLDVVLEWVFTFVNLYHINRIINDRKPVVIPEAIKDIYENIFYNLTTKEFMKYWT